MSAKHTPGPWEACKVGDYGDYDGRCLVVLGDDMRVAVALGEDKTAKANARLIAAAPDLLDALQDLVAMLPDPELDNDDVQKALVCNALAAIKKAGAA